MPPILLATSLHELRADLDATATAQGLTLDLLMREWNGRFATFNVGIPTEHQPDPRRRADGSPRHYRLIGRVKATTRPEGVALTLLPPVACDAPHTEATDAERREEFARAVTESQRARRVVDDRE